MKHILQSLESRLTWYEKALSMFTNREPYENGFGWPVAPGIGVPIAGPQDWQDKYIMYLSGCINELHNTLNIIEARKRIILNKLASNNDKEETKP